MYKSIHTLINKYMCTIQNVCFYNLYTSVIFFRDSDLKFDSFRNKTFIGVPGFQKDILYSIYKVWVIKCFT